MVKQSNKRFRQANSCRQAPYIPNDDGQQSDNSAKLHISNVWNTMRTVEWSEKY